MSHDDTGGFSLTHPAASESSGEAGGDGERTMTGNDLSGPSLVQGVAGMKTPIGGVADELIGGRAGVDAAMRLCENHGL
jgi:hypothetical protein